MFRNGETKKQLQKTGCFFVENEQLGPWKLNNESNETRNDFEWKAQGITQWERTLKQKRS